MIMVKCSDYCDGNGLCIKNTRAALSQPSVSVEELAKALCIADGETPEEQHLGTGLDFWQVYVGQAQAILAKYNVTVKG